MFIHIGGDTVVRAKDVISILDINHVDRNTKKRYYLLDQGENEQYVESIAIDDVKSIVITTNRVYYSPISSMTLKKRAIGFI